MCLTAHSCLRSFRYVVGATCDIFPTGLHLRVLAVTHHVFARWPFMSGSPDKSTAYIGELCTMISNVIDAIGIGLPRIVNGTNKLLGGCLSITGRCVVKPETSIGDLC